MATERIRGYCAQCASFCPIISYVQDGRFVKVEPDSEHPNANTLCPKGLAGPELVYSKQRLQYPMKRTRPKGASDPGWKRISWDDALDTISGNLNEIKKKYGSEAVATARPSNSGSPSGEFNSWFYRLSYAFGTPNSAATTHICQWHRDRCSYYTFGKGGRWGEGLPEFEKAKCILIWGKNPHATGYSRLRDIREGLKNGAKLIVIDPRATKIAGMADYWLRVRPGTDGALVMSMIHIMIEEGLYEQEFVRNWTTGPFLVRSDNQNLLMAVDRIPAGSVSHYTVVDMASGNPVSCEPGLSPQIVPALEGTYAVQISGGEPVECKTAFTLLRERVSEYPPHRTERITGISEGQLRETVRAFASRKPACLFSWNGIEQSICASQTNRAICIFYALTGNYDRPGGNVVLPTPPTNQIVGEEFLDPSVKAKRLGLKERPLGPAANVGLIHANDLYRAILEGEPYAVKALLGIGGNLIMTNPESGKGREALLKLDFHAQAELFLTPTAELADIVLPSASSWESWHVRTDFVYPKARGHVQFRPAVVPPRHESWPDMKIMFELAKRLGIGDRFWDGDIEAGFNYHLAPTGLTVEELRKNPGGIKIDLPEEYEKYRKKNHNGEYLGFPTPSKRIEIYSQTFKDHGYDPLPQWEKPLYLGDEDFKSPDQYPLILTSAKVLQFCHSEHRALPSLRKAVPDPYLEIHPKNAEEHAIQDGEWVILETPYGGITLKAKLTEVVQPGIVCTQHGWWQECKELGLPGYDPYSSDGANLNLILSAKKMDPISGSVPLKGLPCRLMKKDEVKEKKHESI